MKINHLICDEKEKLLNSCSHWTTLMTGSQWETMVMGGIKTQTEEKGTLHPMAYWGGEDVYKVFITEQIGED